MRPFTFLVRFNSRSSVKYAFILNMKKSNTLVRHGDLTKQAIREAKYVMIRLGQYDLHVEITKREAVGRLDEFNAANAHWYFGDEFQLVIG